MERWHTHTLDERAEQAIEQSIDSGDVERLQEILRWARELDLTLSTYYRRAAEDACLSKFLEGTLVPIRVQ